MKKNLRGAFSRLKQNEGGIAAVEFALILPLMLMLYLGLVETSRGLRTSQRVDLMAHTLADLTAQKLNGGDNVGQAGFTDSEIAESFAAVKAINRDKPGLKLVISEVKIFQPSAGAGWKAQVQWTVHENNSTGLRPCGTDLSPSADYAPGNISKGLLENTEGFSASGTYFIVADVSFDYSPGMSFELFRWNKSPTWTFQRTAYAPNRNTYSPPHIQDKSQKITSCIGE